MITKANYNDYIRIVKALNRGEKVDYITVEKVKKDFTEDNLFIKKIDGKIVAIFSIVYDERFKMHYMKRLKILNKRNRGKGIAQKIIKFVSELPIRIAVTPWDTNKVMCRLLEKYGFKLQYKFNECWCLYIS